MYCPKCGTQNPDVALVCSSCCAVLSGVLIQTQTPAPKTSGLAIASLVLGILTPFCLIATGIPAIILGIVGLVKISKSVGRLKGKGLAIAGIVVPIAWVALALLIVIFMPAFARVRQIGLRMVCGTNMFHLSRAMLEYTNDYDSFPTTSKWCDLLIEHADITKKSFRCPTAPGGPCNYAMNKNLENFDMTNAPPDMVAFFETHPGWNQVGGPEMLTTDNHQGEGCNVLFADNSVRFIKTRDIDKLKW